MVTRLDCTEFTVSPDALACGVTVNNSCDICVFDLSAGCYYSLVQTIRVGVDLGADPHADRTEPLDRYPEDSTDTNDPNWMG